MKFLDLQEVDSLEAIVIIDNELDPLSPPAPNTVQVAGNLGTIGLNSMHKLTDRGGACRELQMEDICCSAHGLSILLTATKGDTKHAVLFDAGPEEDAWERNVKRLRPDLASVEVIQLSHWHRDHSGGLCRAIRMIKDAKQTHGRTDDLVVDLHPDRPVYRGIALPEHIISLEADPTFDELADAGAVVSKSDEAHTVLDDMFLISGEIPRLTPYETGLKNAVRYDPEENDWFSDELIADERFLACNIKGKGIVVFTGCSHAGVVNTTKNALKLIGTDVPLHAVVGGFHLAMSDDVQIQSTVSDLKRLDPAVLMPGHCSGWRAKFAIEKHMPGTLVPCTVGIKITF
ncbi:Putative Metallo-beta-lactamase superfamily protein [Penicillium brasilianum]|uniref:Putative Metallo-beta-lactamase superfamily protein n=1 Tax=Penicillium brasilianum TaxID=104259 RepID=A0A0F7TK94_PENBI|nr:Putative Metallo-beta-lactamase superfamily protein [Penicillium brasilianum]